MIEVVGAPFDLGGKRQGSRLGPAAVRLGGLHEALKACGAAHCDAADLPLSLDESAKPGIRNFESASLAIQTVRDAVGDSLRRGNRPLMLGGDHSLAMGSLSAALRHFGRGLAVLWIDAHADLNTPDTSPSGNLHGMSLAAAMGFESRAGEPFDTQWKALRDEVAADVLLQGDRTAWIGLRDVDPGEAARLRQLDGEFAATMYDIDRLGLVDCLLRFDRWLRASGATDLWISFDVDALDPILAPGTGTAVRGGLTYREMHLMGEMLHELMSKGDCPYRLAGFELVEINPLHDAHNETASTAVEWIGSLFGKTILGKR